MYEPLTNRSYSPDSSASRPASPESGTPAGCSRIGRDRGARPAHRRRLGPWPMSSTATDDAARGTQRSTPRSSGVPFAATLGVPEPVVDGGPTRPRWAAVAGLSPGQRRCSRPAGTIAVGTESAVPGQHARRRDAGRRRTHVPASSVGRAAGDAGLAPLAHGAQGHRAGGQHGSGSLTETARSQRGVLGEHEQPVAFDVEDPQAETTPCCSRSGDAAAPPWARTGSSSRPRAAARTGRCPRST